MKAYSEALKAEIGKGEVTAFFLVDLGGLFFYTDCPLGISYDGDDYVHAPLRISGFKTADGGSLDGGSVQIGNPTLEMSSAMLNSTLLGGDAYIRLVYYSKWMELIGADLYGAGVIEDRGQIDEEWGTITISSHLNMGATRFPPRRITRKLFPYLPARGKKLVYNKTIIEVQ